MYRIEIYPSADKALKKINIRDRETVARAIDNLAVNPRPHGYKKTAKRRTLSNQVRRL